MARKFQTQTTIVTDGNWTLHYAMSDGTAPGDNGTPRLWRTATCAALGAVHAIPATQGETNKWGNAIDDAVAAGVATVAP